MSSHSSMPLPMVLSLPKMILLNFAKFSSYLKIQFSASLFQKIVTDFCFLYPSLCAKYIKFLSFYFIINFVIPVT